MTTNEIMKLADAYANAVGELENENWTHGTVGGGSVDYVDENRAALLAAVEAMAQELEAAKQELAVAGIKGLNENALAWQKDLFACREELEAARGQVGAAKESATLWNKRYQDVCQDRISLRQKYGYEIEALEAECELRRTEQEALASQLDDALKLIDAAAGATQKESS